MSLFSQSSYIECFYRCNFEAFQLVSKFYELEISSMSKVKVNKMILNNLVNFKKLKCFLFKYLIETSVDTFKCIDSINRNQTLFHFT